MKKKITKKMHYTFYGPTPKVFCRRKGVKPRYRTRFKKLVTCKNCRKHIDK